MRKSISILVLVVTALAVAEVSFAKGASGGNRGGGASNRGGGASNRGGGASNRGGGTSNRGGGASNRGGGTSNRGGGTSNRGRGASSNGDHHHHHDGEHYVVGYGGAVIVDPNVQSVDYASDGSSYDNVSNSAPAAITLVNPQSNGAALRYRLDDGDVQTLAAGYQVQINQACVIAFDRGGSAGPAQYTMTDGTYRFQPSNGAWELFKSPDNGSSSSSVAADDSNPAPGN